MSNIKFSKPSFMSLLIKMRFNGQEISSGTGFVVESRIGPLLLTNRHNLTGRDQQTTKPLSNNAAIPNELEIYHHKKGSTGQWIPIIEPILNAEDKPIWFEHPTLNNKADIVALKLTILKDVQVYPFELFNFENLSRAVADTVSVIGFPFGITGGGYLAVWATGFIASEPDINYNNLPQFLIDCRSRSGQSGSPVLKYHNGGIANLQIGGAKMLGPCYRLIGIYSGRINSDSDLGIVWNLNSIHELVESVS